MRVILIKGKISSLDKGEKAKTQHPIKLRLPLLESEDTPYSSKEKSTKMKSQF